MWHRFTDGKLRRGTLEIMNTCKCSLEIYQPNDLTQCPYILIVSRHPCTHVDPVRSKTPASVEALFFSLLRPLEWRLADATPCHILLDNTFIYGLRKVLNWKDFTDPGLGNLHASLANYDHTARLINKLRYEEYPKGTGLEGEFIRSCLLYANK